MDFFVVRQLNGPTYYTRAGQFRLDKEGYVVDPNGYRLQAYQMDATGSVTGEIGDVYLAGLMSDPSATNKISMQMNLDSRDDIPSAPWTPPQGQTYQLLTHITSLQPLQYMTVRVILILFIHIFAKLLKIPGRHMLFTMTAPRVPIMLKLILIAAQLEFNL